MIYCINRDEIDDLKKDIGFKKLYYSLMVAGFIEYDASVDKCYKHDLKEHYDDKVIEIENNLTIGNAINTLKFISELEQLSLSCTINKFIEYTFYSGNTNFYRFMLDFVENANSITKGEHNQPLLLKFLESKDSNTTVVYENNLIDTKYIVLLCDSMNPIIINTSTTHSRKMLLKDIKADIKFMNINLSEVMYFSLFETPELIGKLEE